MTRYNLRFRLLALAFAALAGFVDAIGYMKSGGLFVSFMSGNSTRLAIGAAEASSVAAAAAALIGLFLVGVILNVLISSGRRHRKLTATAVVALLLIGAAITQTFGADRAAIATLCIAMGASNTIFQRDGDVSIGVTYMTGTLVRLGQRIAESLLGGRVSAWPPYFFLWLSFVLGGVAGAYFYLLSPSWSMWAAAIWSLGLVAAVWKLTRDTGRDDLRS